MLRLATISCIPGSTLGAGEIKDEMPAPGSPRPQKKSRKGAKVWGGGSWAVVPELTSGHDCPTEIPHSDLPGPIGGGGRLGFQRDRELGMDQSLLDLGEKTGTQKKLLDFPGVTSAGPSCLLEQNLAAGVSTTAAPTGASQFSRPWPPMCWDWVEGTHQGHKVSQGHWLPEQLKKGQGSVLSPSSHLGERFWACHL